MSKIFVRERRQIGQGAGRPRFAIVAIEGVDLKVYAPHIRKVELEKLAEAVGAEVVYLPRGEKVGEEESREEAGKGRRRRGKWGGQG
jgi:cysteine synthase